MKLCIQSAKKLGVQLPLRLSTQPILSNICHIGMGNFHRAHLANYINQLNCLQKNGDQYWAIRGIGIKPQDSVLGKKLSEQDYIFSHKQAQTSKFTFIQSINSMKTLHCEGNVSKASQDIFNEIASPQTKILSLTITQGGYNIDDLTGQFNFSNQDVKHDLQYLSKNEQTFQKPLKTVFAYFYKGIEYRMKNKLSPKLTVMSCDNVQQNGKVCQFSFKSFINAVNNKEVSKYLDQNVVFINSMVDRITPVPPLDALQSQIKAKYNILDNCPILTQEFTQFVIEDKFIGTRPQFERVGVQVVEDVAPYQKMKLRLLNAAHSLLAYTGVLSGYKYAHQGAQDKLIRQFLEEFMDIDATPSLQGGPKSINLKQYKKKLIERFSSKQIKDTLARLCLQGSDRIPKFVIPSLMFHLQTNPNLSSRDLKRYAFHFAAYGRYLYNDQKINMKAGIQNYIIDDKISEQLQEIGRKIYHSGKGSEILEVSKIFGENVYPAELKIEIDRQYREIKQRGAKEALFKMLNQ